MKKIVFSLILLGFVYMEANAQKHFTREGNIAFYSEAPLEKIEAHNNSATSVVDLGSGRMEFAVLIKAFQFEKALMQEHFNENYMESDDYPKSTFKGQIQNLEEIDFSKDGTYDATVNGQLTIHGVTKDVESKGTFTVKDGQISAIASFTVLVADYDIKIPAVVKDNIAKEVRIDVGMDYAKLEN